MSGKNKLTRVLWILVSLSVITSCRMQKDDSENEPVSKDNFIRLSDAQIQLANIKVSDTREGSIGKNLSFTGVLKVNEQSVVSISSRVNGRIEKLFVRSTGESIQKGDRLYDLFSEKLIDAQREYFRLQSSNWNFSGKYEPSLILEDKLLVMGLMPAQIKQLGKDGKILFGITIYSPVAGKIRSINVSEGEYVTEGQPLFVLADDSKLWVEAQVYPDEIQYLKTGMEASATIPITGEMPVKCRISFINPSFEKGRNVTLVRAVIDNPGQLLHPGMLAILNVQTHLSRGIVVPSAAVISGNFGNRIWVKEENGNFTYRQVTTGLQSGDSVLVTSGLVLSDKIVTSGAYLLNSELILKNGTDKNIENNLITRN